MKSSFFEKLLSRVGRLSQEELQAYLIRLASEKGFFETVFDTLQEGVIVLDPAGKLEYYNRAATRLLSLPEPIHHAIDRYLKGFDWQTLLREEKSISRMLEVHYPEHRYLEFYLLPFEQLGKKYFAAIFHDVTQSQAATKEAIESERVQAITHLAAGVAHELGNPLNNLDIHLQLTEREIKKAPAKVAKKLKESIRLARNEIDRLDSIITQFLKAIRPAAPDLQPHSVEQLINETLELLKLELKNRDILVEREIQKKLPEVKMDALQIKQAFYNIIRNAIQAVTENGILRICAEQKDNWIVINFIDNGVGISAEDLPHIAQPYYTTRKEGYGLGLMIVQRIVREHGGELEFESEKSRGTTVRIKLPLRAPRVHLLEEGK